MGKITRGLAVDRLRKRYAAKRVDMHMADVEAETAKLDGLVANTLDDKISEMEFCEIMNLYKLLQEEGVRV